MICPACGYTDNKKIRSLQQNKAYFGIGVARIADKMGYPQKIMHKALAGAFFGFIDVTIGDLVIKVPQSTTGRTTKEFMDFYEFVQDIGTKVGVDIPSPREVNYAASRNQL